LTIQGGGFYGHASGCGILVLAGKASCSGVQCSGNSVGLRAGAGCTNLSYFGNYLSDNETPVDVGEASGVQALGNF
jgi:hypothetical protein